MGGGVRASAGARAGATADLQAIADAELLIDPLRALTALLHLAFLGLWYSTRWGVLTWLVGIVGVVAFALALVVLGRHPPTTRRHLRRRHPRGGA